jgi:hypothetical protein
MSDVKNIKPEEVLNKIKEEVKTGVTQGRGWYRSVLVFTCIVYLVFAFVLYTGTLIFPKRFSPTRMFGMIDGEHPHLQRTAGVLMFGMSVISALPVIFPNNGTAVGVSLILNIALFAHYIVETFVFWALRVEFMVLIFVVLGLNGFWSAREYFYVERKNK